MNEQDALMESGCVETEDNPVLENELVEERQAVKDNPESEIRYMQELKQIVESLPDPNEGRIRELKGLIRKGKLITPDAMREVTGKIAQLFVSGSRFNF